MDEATLKSKYRTIAIVTGSLKPGTGKYKGKQQVMVRCKCGHKFACATSDLFQRRCAQCGEKINRSRRRK